MTALETVRELHVLYGIAMTGRLGARQTEPALCDPYRDLAGDIHWTLTRITAGGDPAGLLRWLIHKWDDAADSSGRRVAALYGSWAQNIKSIG